MNAHKANFWLAFSPTLADPHYNSWASLIGANAVPLVSRAEEATEGQSAVFVFGAANHSSWATPGSSPASEATAYEGAVRRWSLSQLKKHSTKTPVHPKWQEGTDNMDSHCRPKVFISLPLSLSLSLSHPHSVCLFLFLHPFLAL